MVELSLNVEPQFGWGWDAWRRAAAEIERLGFACLYRSDHFAGSREWTDNDSLDLVVSLTWLASHTSRIRFGSLVAPLTFRDPVMLARQAAAIDDLSGGRLISGSAPATSRSSTAGWATRTRMRRRAARGSPRVSRSSRGSCTPTGPSTMPGGSTGWSRRSSRGLAWAAAPGSWSVGIARSGSCRSPLATPTSGTPSGSRRTSSASDRCSSMSTSASSAARPRKSAAASRSSPPVDAPTPSSTIRRGPSPLAAAVPHRAARGAAPVAPLRPARAHRYSRRPGRGHPGLCGRRRG